MIPDSARDAVARARANGHLALLRTVTDEDVLAELERGLAGFIVSIVVGEDPDQPRPTRSPAAPRRTASARASPGTA